MRFAVVGDPVAHSMSPRMHMAAYRAVGLEHTYEAVRATPAELAGVVADLARGRWDGLNVTLPHKRAVLSMVDAVDASASLAGAANTLVRGPGGAVVAHNTDVSALADELRLLGGDVDWPRAHALVLGAGGAARAAAAALAAHLRVRHVTVRARRGAGALVAELLDACARAGASASFASEALSPSHSTEAAAAAIVQCTSAGMSGADAGDGIAGAVSWSDVGDGAVALDVVYAPPETPFLRAARARGLRTAGGAGMLARQGALAFRLWLGRDAPLDAMLAALK